jgi:Glycosyl hydrolase family 99
VSLLVSGTMSARPVAAAYDESHPILAYYYGWWEPERLTLGPNQPIDMPAPGARQIGDDPQLMLRHITEARSAGVDGFIANRIKDMAVLLDLGQAADFRSTYQLDATSAIESQVAEFYKYVDHPAMVRYEGHAVLFFWRSPTRSNEYWSDLRGRVDPDHQVLWMADGDNFAFPAGDAWDGISPYAIAWSANPTSQLPAWGAKARAQMPGKLYVPPVSPGCDDSRIRDATCVQDRANGAYYEAALRGALASNPSWAVVVCSWNEWLEDTAIEPNVQEGDLYLQITRRFAAALKGTSSRSTAPPVA